LAGGIFFFRADANEILIWTCKTYAIGGEKAIANAGRFWAWKNDVLVRNWHERARAGVKTPAEKLRYGTSELVPCYKPFELFGK
jgi:hypothetical protein